ncbi:MAG: fibrobacter succinogenes major paralogous domain-containing protein, partial [Candidatus Magasanikbacteria bacterium]
WSKPSNVYIPTGGNKITLLKPDGASCTTATQCLSGICTGSICVPPPCAYQTSVVYSSVTYPLVTIGTQCWFSQNLNVGTMLASAATVPSNNSLIEKWCYSNSSGNCTTYGGLYTWAEANQLATTCNTTSCTPSTPSQGICPSGWHIPTDTEIKTLESYLGMCAGATLDCVDYSAGGYRGVAATVGTKLKSGGSSGFNFLLAGYRYTDNYFAAQGSNGFLWSASPTSATDAWSRYVDLSNAGVNRFSTSKARGFSVRCLKD